MATATQNHVSRAVAGPREIQQARQLLERISVEDLSGDQLTLSGSETKTTTVPNELAQLLARVIESIAEGGTMTVGTLPREITTTVAASQLGVSRPTLMKMIAAGDLPAHKVGSHTRLLTEDVLTFRRARLERQRSALDELLALEDELEDEAGQPV